MTKPANVYVALFGIPGLVGPPGNNFFVCIVFETHHRDIEVTSGIVTLGIAVSWTDRDALNKSNSTKILRTRDVGRVAARTPVRLGQTEHGWQFVSMRASFRGYDSK